MNETIELCEEELEIIGDFDDNEEAADVTVYCKGISRRWLFTVLSELLFLCMLWRSDLLAKQVKDVQQ